MHHIFYLLDYIQICSVSVQIFQLATRVRIDKQIIGLEYDVLREKQRCKNFVKMNDKKEDIWIIIKSGINL
jgi:hypothetical protein